MPTTELFVWDDFEVPVQARRGQVTLSFHDHLATYIPKRPAAYLRISSDRFGLETGVDRQQEDPDDTRKRLRWPEFVKVYKENDTSAFKKRKVVKDDGTVDWVVLRPKFRQFLADLASGAIDGVIFYDLDRLVRRPRDLEDLSDIVEYVKRPVLGATGGHMNLINDSDRHMARIRVCDGAQVLRGHLAPSRPHAPRLRPGRKDPRPHRLRLGPDRPQQGHDQARRGRDRSEDLQRLPLGRNRIRHRHRVQPQGHRLARRDAVVERQGQQNAPQSALLRHGLVRRPAPG